MTKKLVGVFALALATALGPTVVHAQSNKPSAQDESFVKQAIQGDLAEIEVGKLAEQKGTDQQVKQFGQKLVSDHSENLEKAKSLAQSIGVTPPTAPDAKQKAAYEKLSNLSGEQFDKRFARDMVQDHKEDIAKFERESKKSGQVGQFAQQTLPTLKHHLEMAESLAGKSSTTGSAH
jgi:putative membrane protein